MNDQIVEKMISIMLLVLFLASVVFFFEIIEARDKANSEYWSMKMEQCRSLGSTWDLNNQGECVQNDLN